MSTIQSSERALLAFLPAALEVRDTPPSPLGRLILWVIMVFFVLAVLWAAVGEVDIVAVTQGKIIPSGHSKVIQPLETSVVKRILVENGQQVEQGQVLLELDNTSSHADVEQLRIESRVAGLDAARLNALLASLTQSTVQAITTVADVDTIQQQLQQIRLEKQFGEYRARLASLNSEIEKQQAELLATKARVAQLKATLPLITERATALKKLVDKRLSSREQWLELEQARIEQARELDIQRHRQKMVVAAMESLKQQCQLLTAQTEAQYLAELTETRRKLSNLEQELRKAEQRQTLQYLKAPIKGRVQQLAIHTVGGVVTPAQELLVIVPDTETLEVEAWVQNKDIGFVEAGQVAAAKIEAFPFTKYGTIDAKVESLSQDAVTQENLGLVYMARVYLLKNYVQVENRQVMLTPGMAVTVEIKTGKRKLIEYFLSPLLRYRQESIRER